MVRPASCRRGQSHEGLAINLSTCKYEILASVAEQLGYKQEDEAGDWDLCWTDLSVSLERVARLESYQRLNHFPGMLEICRKAALSRHLARMAARCPGEGYSFYPTSLILPEQLEELVAALKRNKARLEAGSGAITTYILKPTAGAMGRGISLVQTASHLQECDIANSVAQQYIANPLLVDGFKFDLRIYALVTSCDPLQIYIFDEGLARLATQPYTPPALSNLKSMTVHLTNTSVNKRAPGYVSSDTCTTLTGASKRLASVVLQQVADRFGVPKQQIVASIEEIVIKTIIGIQPLLAHTYHTAVSCQGSADSRSCCSVGGYDHGLLISLPKASTTMPLTQSVPAHACGCPASRCFELLGFDIILDETLKPWLLEVNHSPSFACDSRLDQSVKSVLLADAIRALGQTPDAKRAHRRAQAQQQTDRLYSSGINAPAAVRRPLAAMPRSKALQAAARALDKITAAECLHEQPSSANRSHVKLSAAMSNSRTHNTMGSSTSAGPPIAASVIADMEGSVSLFSTSTSAAPQRPRVGHFHQVFPPMEAVACKQYASLLATAAEAFPDQRCQCAWCLRRMRVRYLQSGAELLQSRAAAPSGHMFTAAGGPTDPCRPATRSSMQQLANRLQQAVEEEEALAQRHRAEQQWSARATGSVCAAERSLDTSRTEHRAWRRAQSAGPASRRSWSSSPAVCHVGCDGSDPRACNSAQSGRQGSDPQFHSNAGHSQHSDSAQPTQARCSSARHLRSHMQCPGFMQACGFHGSRSSSVHTPPPPNSSQALSSAVAAPSTCSPILPGTAASTHEPSSSAPSSAPGVQVLQAAVRCVSSRPSRPPRVPRVALLSSARRPAAQTVDAQLLTMRMHTAAMLSNRFVSLNVTGPAGETGRFSMGMFGATTARRQSVA